MRGLRWVLLISVLSVLNAPAWGSSVEVTNDASAVGNYGLAVTLEPNPTAAAYVQEFLAPTNALRVRFRWRPGTVARWSELDPTTATDDPAMGILHVGLSHGTPTFTNRMASVWMSVRGGEWALWGVCRLNSGSYVATPLLSLPNSVTETNNFLQLEFMITASSGVADGTCCLSVEGVAEKCKLNLANDQVNALAVSLGASLPVRMPSDVSGTFHIDEVIVSN